ncbi:unnamed protein product [Penicillium nalgiovense]|uniref:Uncharacterized protein n=1 Tax=Penicillium nalgiovense TaxID=60175 RepID=A0A9W4MY09_PENNA|nr:unnamed protein product [Penicillium nalgiovense]CAG8143986.1 unnamed protein product [Penicillium nalgiovense]CAG8152013.1 unnamed protein product [Penicillium nalgiovense]CAG8154109.1 unnamed protein product [Penicillium nalgiovense]CAG8157772.1 unnamed protein product [Penicillium nalgiovense]
MTRMTNLMECFKLGDVELNGPLDDNSLDSFKDTYFIAFIAKDAKFDQSTHTALTCFAEHDYIVVAPNPTGSTGYGSLERGLDYICPSTSTPSVQWHSVSVTAATWSSG